MGQLALSWSELLEDDTERVLPWLGGRQVHAHDRTWTIAGPLPPEHGWYRFDAGGGRKATLLGPAEADFLYEEGHPLVTGYVVGDRLIPDEARVEPDPTRLVGQTVPVFLVEPGLDRFARAVTARDRAGRHVYLRQEWPEGPEDAVLAAWQDRKESVDDIPEVRPALDLAFRWLSYQRDVAEGRIRAAEERRQAEEEAARLAEIERATGGTAVTRREIARRDFEAAARAALRISGAELLDARDSYTRGNKVVQYRFRDRRFECEVDGRTLQVIDAGVCLDDHMGTKGDTFFTLESLPGVIGEAMNLGVLVVWRHVPDDDPPPERGRRGRRRRR